MGLPAIYYRIRKLVQDATSSSGVCVGFAARGVYHMWKEGNRMSVPPDTVHAPVRPTSKLRCQTHNMSNVLQFLAGPLSGNRLAVTLWNRCSETINITMTLPDVGLDGSSAYSVRDLWKVSYIVFLAN